MSCNTRCPFAFAPCPIEEPVRTLRVNLGGTETVLDACCKFEKPVLVASTDGVGTKTAIAAAVLSMQGPTSGRASG